MEKTRQHRSSLFIRLYKSIFVFFAFAWPVFVLSLFAVNRINYKLSSVDDLLLLITITILPVPFLLVTAYFHTDLEVDDNGLLVDFLWKKLHVPWDKVIQMKPLLGLRLRKNGIYVVIVDGLTPLHRLFGILYGFSLKPAFILWPNVTDFEVLKNDIEKHIKKNLRKKS